MAQEIYIVKVKILGKWRIKARTKDFSVACAECHRWKPNETKIDRIEPAEKTRVS